MSLEKTWQNLDDSTDDDLAALLQAGTLKKASQDPIQRIRKNLLINICWCVIISIGYIIVIIAFPIWQVQLCLLVVLLFTIYGLITALQHYRRLNYPPAETQLLSYLQWHYSSITKWIDTVGKVALFVYPVSAAGGFMLGASIGSGKSIEYLFSKTLVQVSFPITIAVLVPLCYLLAKWMNKITFGKHLEQIKKNIDELKAGE
jgi:hypothetical protein